MCDSAWERIEDKRASALREPMFHSQKAQEIALETAQVVKQLKDRYSRLEKAISLGLLRSAKDISEGGEIHALFEMCLGRELGVLFEAAAPDPYRMLAEGLGGFVMAIDPHFKDEFESLLPEAQRLGVVHRVPELVWRPGDKSFDILQLREFYLKHTQENFWG
jgi:phosphoribosylformylglycinamidine (FGAM) synthase-like enzyme